MTASSFYVAMSQQEGGNMKIGLRGGHSPNCKGAIGILDEQAEVRKIYYELTPMLQAAGHTVINCNSDEYNSPADLSRGTNTANANGCDIFISIHMNKFDGSGKGTECWLYNASNGTMNTIADKVCQNFAAKGFRNRGIKYNTGFHDLNATRMPAMIVETLFCDNSYDVGLYNALGAKGIAELIAAAIAGQTVSGGAVTPVQPTTPLASVSGGGPTINFKYRVRTKEDGWLPEVINLADYAGIPGHAITDIAIGVDRGSLWYQVHVKGGVWLPTVSGYNINDYNNGYAGNGQVIDAVRVYYNTPADYAAQYGYQKAQYRVSPLNGNYWPWQYDNETGAGQDGYAGAFGQAMDRFQLF